MDVVALANFFAEKELEPGPIDAWRVDRCIATALGVKVGTVVWLSYYNFLKICLTHPEVRFPDYERLPEVLARGFAFRGRKRTVEVCHLVEGKPVKAVLKATESNEVFLKTFHRIDRNDVRRLYKKAVRDRLLCRTPDTELARYLMHRASGA